MIMKKAKKIAVIGVGSTGLSAIKSCVEENLEVTAYERSDDIGGLWRFRKEVVDGQASVMKSTVINTSKEMSAFSDFPAPDSFPNFMHNSNMMKYFRLYAKEFDLLKYIRFNHEILNIAKNDDYDETGKWRMKIRDLSKNVDFEDVVDGVMICTGHHAQPKMPSFPGMDSFRGKIIHSHSYRVPDGYEDKNVLVVGIGNSGADVAVELGTVAKTVYMSTRSGVWVIPRRCPTGTPIEFFLNNRITSFLQSRFPNLISSIVEAYANFHFNHALYDMKPKHRLRQQHPTISDLLCVRVLAGTVTMKGNVKRFTENGVIFVGDEDHEYPIDVAVMATGYFIKLPYFEKGLLSFSEDHIDLYKFVFPLHLKHPTLAFIGMVQPIGSIFPIGELQSRWFAQLMIGNVKLPSKKIMEEDIANKAKTNQTFIKGWRHVIEVIYVPYMDEVANEIGSKPNLFKLLLTDPKLFWYCLSGPCVPYQYRLVGPRPWSGAREAIMNVNNRMATALRTRNVTNASKTDAEEKSKIFLFVLFSAISAFIAFCVYFFRVL